MKACKRLLILGMVLCMMLSMSGVSLAAEVPETGSTEEIVVDTGEETAETADVEAEQPESEENQTEDPSEDTQTIRIQDVSAQTVQVSKPITTQSAQVLSDKTLRILAVGNSFTNDTMAYAAQIAHSAGYNVTVGVLWESGSSLEEHVNYIERNSPVYKYEKFSRSSGYNGVERSGVAPNTAFSDEKWDLVFLQQVSYLNGDADSLLDADGNSYITQMISLIRDRVNNSSLSFSWLMGWAYARDFEGTSFVQMYQGSQDVMYRKIAAATKNTVWSSGQLDSIIPVGTAIQNVRSSYIGDNLNRDGKHLTYSLGRYAAGLTVASSIGINISKVTYFPSGSAVVSSLHKPMLVQAVKNAVSKPFAVTQSTYKSAPTEPTSKITSITNTPSGAKISWKSCSGAAYYRVYRRTGSGSWSLIGPQITKTSYTDTSASNGGSRQYRILAHFDSNLDNTRSSSAANTWLSVPSGIKVSPASSSVSVSWKTSSKASGYQVRYSTSNKMANTKMVSVGKTGKAKISGLKAGKTYYIQVRAKKTSGGKNYSSAWSSARSVKTLSNTPAKPTGVKASAGEKSVTLRWKESSRATGYQIRYSASSKMTNAKTVSVGTVSKKVITGLKAEKTYYIQIRARRTAGGKAYSSGWTTAVSCKTK